MDISLLDDAADLGSSRDLEFFTCALEQLRLHGQEAAVRRWVETNGREPPTAFFKYPMSALLPLLYQTAEPGGGCRLFPMTLR
ncbi:hypothetical protein [Archangium sp.]|uniref:hypothetical protein n=1 Tax=Archangium sp. TaxID=1872627 RepID=UPI00286BE27D|nr:hypothetical protein [Archangium sp.]